MEFKDWFFRQFPEHHQISDTYVDVKGEGLLQRYLRGFGMELDENFLPYIINFTDIIDLEKCDDKFLPLIGTILGNPPSIDGTHGTYRKILLYAIAIYKVKGTPQAYDIFSNLLGITTHIVEAIPLKKITYDDDSEPTYDMEPTAQEYDSECEYCSDYQIAYEGVVAQETLDSFTKVICFLQPINAKFTGFIPA